MAQQTNEELLTGVIPINKPQDFTSFDVVAVVRKLTGIKKIGHSGTLDPMATGVLPVFLNGATKFTNLLPQGADRKNYSVTLQFGKKSNTLDKWGDVEHVTDCMPEEKKVLNALSKFNGELVQVPPMYSAIKVNGVRLYNLARQGIEIEREGRKITIYSIDNINYKSTGELAFDVLCSKGTYIRSICGDLGDTLGCGAIMTSLRRNEASGINVTECITLEQLEKICDFHQKYEHTMDGEKKVREDKDERQQRINRIFPELKNVVLPVKRVLEGYRSVTLSEKQCRMFVNGVVLSTGRISFDFGSEPDIFMVVNEQNEFLGLAKTNKINDDFSVVKILQR